MSDPVAILLVPKPEYAEALLRCGPCGTRPPIARINSLLVDTEWVPIWVATRDNIPDGSGLFSLVLAWKGENVPEGWDRLIRIARKIGSPLFNLFPAGTLACARAYERAGFGTIVLLDADGRVISDG